MIVERVGVAGAGTMGAGIAQVAALGGFETRLHDPDAAALDAGIERAGDALRRGVEKDMWSDADAGAAVGRIGAAPALEDLAGCELAIEAAPEDLEVKHQLMLRLAEICGDGAILATNTSSLSVTAIAAPLPRPERVCGLHFFNPPALMKLVEVVAGDESAEDVLAAATDVAERMGREPIRAADGIGFVANRCARPYTLESLRLLGDRIAGHEEIDRIMRLGGGFRMGPFELMDLVGIDVNFGVARSFWEQSFHEPRWQPHPLQERMVAAGRLGRKTKRGWYSYADGPHRDEDSGPPRARTEVGVPGDDPDVVEAPGMRALRVETASLGALAAGEDVVGFVALPDLAEATLVELTRTDATSDATAAVAERHFEGLGKHVQWVGDAPGLVLGRVVAQLVNEAHFAAGQGVGTPDDIDKAMRLGFNHPRGPFEWAKAIGPGRVVAILDGLHRELGEERYRAAPSLRRRPG